MDAGRSKGAGVHGCCNFLLVGALAVVVAEPAQTQDASTWSQTDPRYGFLTPIPDHGAVPPIVQMALRPAPQELEFRARSRDYGRQIRWIRHEYLGKVRVQALRERGIAELQRLEDPAAFKPLIEELAREQDDVRLAVLDHLTAQGDEGQAALAWVAIHDGDDRIRHEATRRLVAPASPPVLRVLDQGLRSPVHEIANHAGTVAGATFALETIPLLIFAQATGDPVENEGDLAWILVATQTAYVAGIEPIVGSGSGAFAVIPGVVQEGVLLRVVDAVAIFYRTEIHRVLVGMTTDDWGRPTDHLAYDMKAWWQWYNAEYVPFKNEQLAEQALIDQQVGSD
jgi:hypothetical protein